MYDTSVEAFDTKGTDIDDISAADFIEELAGEDEVIQFIQDNTPSEQSQVEKFEYFDIKEESSLLSHQPEGLKPEQSSAVEVTQTRRLSNRLPSLPLIRIGKLSFGQIK